MLRITALSMHLLNKTVRQAKQNGEEGLMFEQWLPQSIVKIKT